MARLVTYAALALALLCLAQGRAQPQQKPQPKPQPKAPAQPAGARAGAGAAAAAAAAGKPRADYVEAQGAGHYKVHAQRVTWPEAQAACAAEGAHLLVLNSKKEAAAVADLLARQPRAPAPGPGSAAPATTPAATAVSNELHAGFFLPDYFVTAFGTPLSSIGYQKWAPDQQHTQICGSINHAALLYDAKCTDKRSFICEFRKDATAAFKLTDAPILLPDSTPQQKYTPMKLTPDRRYVGLVQQGRLHYYRVSEPSEKMRWARANSVCQDEGGHLLVINHQFEADTLKDHLKKLNIASDVYVGLRNGPNKFVTVFGKTLVNAGYVNWESEQPEDETCLAVDQNMLLKKIPCWEERQFICEMTLL